MPPPPTPPPASVFTARPPASPPPSRAFWSGPRADPAQAARHEEKKGEEERAEDQLPPRHVGGQAKLTKKHCKGARRRPEERARAAHHPRHQREAGHRPV